MRTLSPLLSRLLALVLFAGYANIHAADENKPETPVDSIAVPGGLSAEKIQKNLILAAEGRGWQVTAKDDEKVMIKLDHHGWNARVEMRYTTKAVLFFSDSTKNGKPEIPKSWIKNLKQDIEANLTGS